MRIARVVSTSAVGGAVLGCAVLAISMASAAADGGTASRSRTVVGYAGVAAPALTGTGSSAIPALRAVRATSTLPSSKRVPPRAAASRQATSSTAIPNAAATRRPTTARAAGSTRPITRSAHPAVPDPTLSRTRATRAHPAETPAARTTANPTSAAHRAPPVPRTTRATARVALSARRGHNLPLGNYTGRATEVITVVARSTNRTTATLQAWTKAAGGGWWRVGSPMTAHIGSDGMTRYPSESKSATPIGSFTLTRAFGHDTDPGTALPYRHTSGADWWISQSGPLYNTLQHCWSGCAFTRGSPNEHIYDETPYYNYAVVIDYNTRNAGRVRQGAGSAFFLHVSVGTSTAGCVSIPQRRLVSIMRWLRPGAHPRILIGTS